MSVVAAPTRTGLVTVLRAGAALLVVYSYLVGLWLQLHGANPQPVAGIREWFNRPLRLGEDFGPFALMVLLLCTGWTTAGARCRSSELVRTAMPVLVAAPLAALALASGLDTPPRAELAFLASIIGSQLIGWLVGRHTWLVPVLLVSIGVLGAGPLAKPALFLTMVLVGHVVRRVSGWAGLLLGVGCFAALTVVDQTNTDLARWWYPVAATYAVLVFLAMTGVEVPEWPVTRWLADRAEWLLVSGVVVGFAGLGLLHLRVPLSVAILTALAATGLAADAGHRLTRAVT